MCYFRECRGPYYIDGLERQSEEKPETCGMLLCPWHRPTGLLLFYMYGSITKAERTDLVTFFCPIDLNFSKDDTTYIY